jgi:hypothetical protein
MRWSAYRDRAEILSGLVEAGAIRSTTVFRIGKLDRVIFPPTHLADQPCSRWLFVESEVPTTRARVAIHIDIVGHRKELSVTSLRQRVLDDSSAVTIRRKRLAATSMPSSSLRNTSANRRNSWAAKRFVSSSYTCSRRRSSPLALSRGVCRPFAFSTRRL